MQQIQLPIFHTGSLKLKTVQSQNYNNSSKVMRLEKFFFALFPLSLVHCGCIYDSKNMKFIYNMNNWLTFYTKTKF